MGEYALTGSNFDLIPDDAVGIFSYSNSEPLAYINSTLDTHLYSIVEKSGTSMRVRQRVESTHSVPGFLGGIVSADRSVIYWVNRTRPLAS